MLYKTVVALALLASGTDASGESGSTCSSIKAAYQDSACCNDALETVTNYVIGPPPSPPSLSLGENPCHDKKPTALPNTDCTDIEGVVQVAEQAGANVTEGYVGLMTPYGTPITDAYWEAGLCPVNVHWHLGAEHLSVGEYDENGVGPDHDHRRLSNKARRLAGLRELEEDGEVRMGFNCHLYDENDAKFTTEYEWKHCHGMEVGQTYEVHWPHSAAGACGTPYQFQSPFYDGVFCVDGIIALDPLNTFEKIGVQAQIFTIVNDEDYYYADLMRGMIMDGDFGADIAKYTGSTTGTSRDNEICSQFTPITWQVDRKCHLISASSFDKMCADMKTQSDDMSDDLHAHGARELVADELAASNLQNRRRKMGAKK